MEWIQDIQKAREELGLEELLRRCHRDELIPLALDLGVNPQGLGTGKLAAVISATLRRAGAHELENLVLRRGEGPGYPRVLRELALRQGAPVEPTLERTELSVMRTWLSNNRDELPAPVRAELELFLEEPPTASTEIIPSPPDEEEDSPGRRILAAGSLLRFAPFMFLLPPVTLAAGAWWLGRPKDQRLLPAVLEVARLRQLVRHRVTVGVVGSPSAGKDAAIKAIFGLDTGNVHPVAGSTREVSITRLPGARALYLVNTPGMGDVVQAVTEEAKQILHHIDVFVYVVNTQGGVQARELNDYRTCLAMGRPVLAVINKIDTLRERDRQRYLDDARHKLSAPEEDFLPAAFDPLPQLSPGPIGVQEVRAWITRHLVELGKDPTELPWVPGELDASVRPPGAMVITEDGLGED